jgi:hypothetical protein
MDEEDFLAAVEADNVNAPVEDKPVEETPPAETPPEPEQPTPEEPAQPEATPEAQPVVEMSRQPDPGFVPIGVVLDTRDKLKAAEAELAQLRAQTVQPEVEIPDPDLDPHGFANYQQVQQNRALLNTRLDLSEDMARERHGDDLVDKARDWALGRFRDNPAFQAEVLGQRNPYGHIVREFQRQDALARIGDPSEIDAFLAWKAAQGQLNEQQAAQPPGQAAPPNPAPSIPPRSLASAPSAGGIMSDVAQTDAEIFEEVIPKG